MVEGRQGDRPRRPAHRVGVGCRPTPGTGRNPLMYESHPEGTPVEIVAAEKAIAEARSALEEVEGAVRCLGDYPYWESDVPLAADLALQNMAMQVTFVRDALKAIQGREELD